MFSHFSLDVSPFTESMPVRQKLGTASAIVNQPRQYQPKHHHEHHFTGPFFEGPLNPSDGALSVAVHLYTEGIFNCRVGMLKDKTVSRFTQINFAMFSGERTFFIDSTSIRFICGK